MVRFTYRLSFLCTAVLACQAQQMPCLTRDKAFAADYSHLIFLETHHRLELPDNTLSNVMSEIAAPDFIPTIASVQGLDTNLASKAHVAKICGEDDMLVCIGTAELGDSYISKLSDAVQGYARGRFEGLSRDFLLQRPLQKKTAPPSDPVALAMCNDLVHQLPLRVDHLTHKETHVITNAVGKTFPSATYSMSDNGILWTFSINTDAEGHYRSCWWTRQDAKNADPEYQRLFEEIEKKVKDQMKAEGGYGQFGSCHTFWSRKKQLLKEMNVNWLTPVELNPDARFD